MEGWSVDLCDGQQQGGGRGGEGIREDLPYEDVSHRIGAIICHELNVARLEA